MSELKSSESRRKFLKNSFTGTAGAIVLSNIPAIVRGGFPTIVPSSVLEKMRPVIKLMLHKLVAAVLPVHTIWRKHLNMMLPV